jgi:hypothetical protein
MMTHRIYRVDGDGHADKEPAVIIKVGADGHTIEDVSDLLGDSAAEAFDLGDEVSPLEDPGDAVVEGVHDGPHRNGLMWWAHIFTFSPL